MYVLTVNAGSSSVKLAVFDKKTAKQINNAVLDRLTEMNPKERSSSLEKLISDFLEQQNISPSNVKEVVHRVVHGGRLFNHPVEITKELKRVIQDLSKLAPLHNPHNLHAIEVCENFFEDVRQIAVFDTAYHANQPELNRIYGLPSKLTKEYGLYRYGFHGISHQYMNQMAASNSKVNSKEIAVVSCHLGGGSSITASLGGRSIYCSMGFTPLEGIPMGTRVGDIDPGLVTYLQSTLGYSLEKLDDLFWNKSGVLGVSGYSSDMRDILHPNPEQKVRADFTLQWYCQKVAAGISMATTMLPKLDVIAFSGGIGQNSGLMRKIILDKLWQLKIDINKQANQDNELIFSSKSSSITLMAVEADEAQAMFDQSRVVT